MIRQQAIECTVFAKQGYKDRNSVASEKANTGKRFVAFCLSAIGEKCRVRFDFHKTNLAVRDEAKRLRLTIQYQDGIYKTTNSTQNITSVPIFHEILVEVTQTVAQQEVCVCACVCMYVPRPKQIHALQLNRVHVETLVTLRIFTTTQPRPKGFAGNGHFGMASAHHCITKRNGHLLSPKGNEHDARVTWASRRRRHGTFPIDLVLGVLTSKMEECSEQNWLRDLTQENNTVQYRTAVAVPQRT